MNKKAQAIGNCRVSSYEQLDSQSLSRQEKAVKKAAEELGVELVKIWSGNRSSKKGNNLKREDLEEMLEMCKRNRHIKYAIFDEPDRFMRSMLEMGYFIIEFKKLGVEIKFASKTELNTETAKDTLILMLEAFKAEGSNEERQSKSINGQVNALREGRYTFRVKPGYRKGIVRGVQEVDPYRGPVLKKMLVRLASELVLPTQALKELNASDFMKGRALYKMDKFRKLVTDPFYAGIVEMDKQVKFRNENGLHNPLITKEQHYKILEIMDNKKKNQKGPRKNGNPKYPLSNIVSCAECINEKYGRLVGFDHGNGSNKSLVYEKYRCRSCKRYVTREYIHSEIKKTINRASLTENAQEQLEGCLTKVWKDKELETAQELIMMRRKLSLLKEAVSEKVEAATDPSNAPIRQEIMALIDKKKEEVSDLESLIESSERATAEDKGRFFKFALRYVNDMGDIFFDISKESRLRCKQMLFPGGFYIDADRKVYTPEISIFYRLETNKKDSSNFEKSSVVRVRRL